MKQPSAFKEIEGVPLSCPSDTVKEINSEADIDDLLGKIRLLTDFMEKYNRTESTAKKE